MKRILSSFLPGLLLVSWTCLYGQAPGVPPMVMLRGVVIDAEGASLAANIEVYDHVQQQWVAQFATNPQTGAFFLTVPAGKHYGMVIWKEDYLFYSENISASYNAYQEKEIHITLQKAAPGKRLMLYNIFFKPGRATLHPYSFPELEAIHRVLAENPGLNMQVHTTPGDNKKLSQKRARRLIRYLKKQGISRKRMCCLIRHDLLDEPTPQTLRPDVDRKRFEIVLTGRQ